MMNNKKHETPDYLFDPTDTASTGPDSEIQKIEGLLNQHQFDPTQHQPPDFSSRDHRNARKRWQTTFAAVAATLLISLLAWQVLIPGSASTNSDHWQVRALNGATQLGNNTLTTLTNNAQWQIDDWLITGPAGRAEIEVADLGYLTVEADSQLRLLATSSTEQRLELAQGKLQAIITAPPRLFFVDTPAATAVDLGCIYTLEVDAQGNGTLAVTLGWVELERGANQIPSTVPSDAVCQMTKDLGPGTPYFADAPTPWINALNIFDTQAGTRQLPAVILTDARPRDSLTLWHLLTLTDITTNDRQAVFARLNLLSPPPAGVTQAGILNQDHNMLQKWWRSLKQTW